MYTTYHISYNTLIYSRIESSIHFNPPNPPKNPSTKKTLKKNTPPKPSPFFQVMKKIYPTIPLPRSPLEVGPPGFSSATMLLGSMEMFGAKPQRPTLFSSPTTRKCILQKTNKFSVVGSCRGGTTTTTTTTTTKKKKMFGQKKKRGGMNLFLNNGRFGQFGMIFS